MSEPKRLLQTASQTAGPYVHIGLAPGAAGFDVYRHELGRDIAGPETPGTRIRVEGMIWDGDDQPVKDALLELWQADADGRYADAETNTVFHGWGRGITDFDSGLWSFDTIKPGAVEADGVVIAPHLNLWVVARGINIGLNTRVYFADEAAANAADPILARIEEARRTTLMAEPTMTGDVVTYRFDIRLQGERETIFFDL